MPSLESEKEKPVMEVSQATREDPLAPKISPSELHVEANPASQENASVSNGESEKTVMDPLQYQVETVDFPDSPQPTKKIKSKPKEHPLQVNSDDDSEDLVSIAQDLSERPGTLLADGTLKKKKIKVTPGILNSDDPVKDEDVKSLSSLSNKSDVDMMSPMEDLATPDDIETPDDMDESTLNGVGSYSEMIPELSAVEEFEEERSWKTCCVGGSEQKIDMKVIEPYKKVLSHGGYFGPSRHAIIVFSACNLPDKSRRDYDYVMDNLFFYVLSTLDQLVAEDYILVYLHGATQRSNMPTFGWLKRCYQMIDRRLRKNLKGLYLVHPTFWLKTIVIMTKPFVSTKFSRKLQFVNTLKELSELIPMDQVCIPDKVKQLEFKLMIEEKKLALKSRRKVYPEVYSTPRRPLTSITRTRF